MIASDLDPPQNEVCAYANNQWDLDSEISADPKDTLASIERIDWPPFSEVFEGCACMRACAALCTY